VSWGAETRVSHEGVSSMGDTGWKTDVPGCCAGVSLEGGCAVVFDWGGRVFWMQI
jgi:hypothetical protein